MENYKVLARKYRPTSLAELRGQDVFVRILNNSIKYNKIAHAYLLTGIRGVGKTSIARIVAKTISCESPKIENDLIVPCKKCKNCQLVEQGNHSDILEFDAASHTSVNDIRDMIESVHYAPVFGKYKIYIIDEVHMLSNSAFNALLKILEEPPHNVIFIFATTEIRKVPLTIISRCQRFDLHRFNIADIATHLEKVCTGEKISFEKDALDIIAKHSGGSMRDALTMLESVTAINQSTINVKIVRDVLGINDVKFLYELLDYTLEGNTIEALNNVYEIYAKGGEAGDIVNELMVIATKVSKYIASNKDEKILSLLDSYEKELLKNVCNKTYISRLTIVWQILFKGLKELKFIEDTLSALEMLIIRCCYASSLPSLDELLNTSQNQKSNQELVTQDKEYSFADLLKLVYQNKEMIVYHQLRSEVNVYGIDDNKIILSLDKRISNDFIAKFTNVLSKATGKKWIVEISASEFKKAETIEAKELYDVQNHSVIKEILKEFPGTKIKTISEAVNN